MHGSVWRSGDRPAHETKGDQPQVLDSRVEPELLSIATAK